MSTVFNRGRKVRHGNPKVHFNREICLPKLKQTSKKQEYFVINKKKKCNEYISPQ